MSEIKHRKRIVGNEAPDGYLFGSVAKFPPKGTVRFDNVKKNVYAERRFGIEKKDELANRGAWDYHSEPIENYAGLTNSYPIEKILARKIKEHNEFHLEPFRVLDAGIGTGKQWVDFARKNGLVLGVDFEVHGTSLTKNGVIPELKDKVKMCTANNIHLKFRRAPKFDFVISHYGMHEMEEAGIESAFRTLKPNGEIFVCGIWTRPVPRLVKGHEVYARLIETNPPTSIGTNYPLSPRNWGEWFLHLKKK